MADLRYYQDECVKANFEAKQNGLNPMNILATGTGKTVIAAELMRHMVHNQKNVLFMAHRGELLTQAKDKIYRHFEYEAEIEKARLYATHQSRIHLGSVQSIQKKRLERFKPNYYDYIMTDEAHRSAAATYRNVYDYHPLAMRMGFTATADRRDGVGFEGIYDTIAYEYPLHRAIKDGFLVPIHGRVVEDFEMDLSELRRCGRDFSEEDLEDLVKIYLGPLSESVKNETEGKMTLVFLPSVASCELMTESLQSIGIKAGFIHGGLSDKERSKVLYDFHVGNITHFMSCDILIEGYDEPGIEAIVMAYPTTSRGKFSQMVGRGTRLFLGKTHLQLVEFTYNSSKLKLVDSFDLFATAGFEEDVRDQANREGDLLANLEEAHEDFYDHTAIMKRLVCRSEGKKMVTFNPFEICNLKQYDLQGEFDMAGEWTKEKISSKQLEYLNPFNFDGVKKLKRGQASELIGQIVDNGYKSMSGSITSKQKDFLTRKGVNTSGLNKAQAGVLITELHRS